MALHSLRLRRAALSLSSYLQYPLIQSKPVISLPNVPHLLQASTPSAVAFSQLTRPFAYTTTLFLSTRSSSFDPNTEEIGPDTILFEGCDYNHWLITIDFPKDSELSREQKIECYVNTAAQVFGSVEEAKKKIYALSTTTYQGFQVECSEETSEKFRGLPGVVFILPDSYIDPVNKEYGGDKYVNGEIFPRPPPIHYGRRNRDRRPRDQTSYQQGNPGPNYGPPPQHNYGPPPQQNFGPPPQQNFGPPPQQNFRPTLPPQQNYGTPPQQNYGTPPQQNYGPPPQQNYGPPPQQNYGPPSQQNYGPPPQQNYGPSPQQNYRSHPQQNSGPPSQQNYEPRPEQGYAPPQQQNHNSQPSFEPQQNYRPPGSNQVPSYQGFGHGAQGQRESEEGIMQSNLPPERRGFSQ